MSPHVVVLARLEKIERMVGEQPETIRGIFKEELEKYVVNGFSMEQLWGMMREDADRGYRQTEALLQGLGIGQREEAVEEEVREGDPRMVRWGGMKFHHGQLRRIGECFQFPDCGGAELLQMWLIGSKVQQVPPLWMLTF